MNKEEEENGNMRPVQVGGHKRKKRRRFLKLA
jgi:hypothetical protein